VREEVRQYLNAREKNNQLERRALRMRRSVLAIGLVLVLAAAAEAADFCVSLNSGANILVGKAFRVPSKGSCKAFSGFIQTYLRDLFNGNACTASNGSEIEFNLVGSARGIETLNVTLPLPSLTGGSGIDTVAGGSGSYSLTADKVACSPPVVPVP
jgi:hypothetical protein